MNLADLIVVGGGPAGTAAAITAARSGAKVLLFEAGRFPRHKVCGEFVSAESLNLLRGLLVSGDASLLRDALRIGHARLFIDERLLSTEVEPAAASISRFDLDAALWEAAIAAGVGTFQRVKVHKVCGGGPFVVATAEGDFTARAVINASGRWSNLRRAPSPNGTAAKWIGLKAHFAEASPSSSVDLYFFSGGYCGVQPVGPGTVNAAAMVRAEVASALPAVLELHPALGERSRDWKMVSDPLSVAPLRFETPEPLRNGILMAGDAAGFVDPFVGDGISLALRSGELAARCLAEFFVGRISLVDAAESYAHEYQRRFASVFRSSARLRRMMHLPSAVRKPVLSFLQRSPATMRQLVKRTR